MLLGCGGEGGPEREVMPPTPLAPPMRRGLGGPRAPRCWGGVCAALSPPSLCPEATSLASSLFLPPSSLPPDAERPAPAELGVIRSEGDLGSGLSWVEIGPSVFFSIPPQGRGGGERLPLLHTQAEPTFSRTCLGPVWPCFLRKCSLWTSLWQEALSLTSQRPWTGHSSQSPRLPPLSAEGQRESGQDDCT